MNDFSRPLHIAATGYVSTCCGSVAGANALFLRELLRRGHRVAFHSKPHYVDPRPVAAGSPGEGNLHFTDCTNGFPDRLKRWTDKYGGRSQRLLGPSVGMLDDRSYRRHVARAIDLFARESHTERPDLALWLGTWATRRARGLPTVSFVQGPPGTDARSIARHREMITRLAGRAYYLKLRAYARWRLDRGLPPIKESDHVIVGSQWSRQVMTKEFEVPAGRVHVVPYPIDLELFRPPATPRSSSGPLRVLWLGRFAPRKRLDLFLDGLTEAIRQGVDAQAVVVGKSAFVPNYERLIGEFPFPKRLSRLPQLPRNQVPGLMATCDVVAQPSDEEDFGSSVAEGLACGMPAIVGRTNGTSEYLCERSIHLTDDRVTTFAAAIAHLSAAKRDDKLADPLPSRRVAERHFSLPIVTDRLVEILWLAMRGRS